MNPQNHQQRRRLALYGTVQGVGFRPFVYRLAQELELTGWVRNSAQGALIEIQGSRNALDQFETRLHGEKPPACWIAACEVTVLEPSAENSFAIIASEDIAGKTAFLLPDLATCDACLAEMRDPSDRRYRYPFLNCTHCGPRYSIIQTIPYDRPNTTMAGFPLCERCAAEYRDPTNRRFHAQPVACPACGPRLLELSLEDAAAALERGDIVAMKGIGGFQLLCDARSQQAVARLRERKHREQKPFAVMFPTLDAIRHCAMLSLEEERVLSSAAAPVVLLRRHPECALAPNVSGASPYVGAMLPYSPLHHLLLARCGFPLVATSGNRSDEPIAIDNDEARERLGGIANGFVLHNRPIARPCDDSVVRVSHDGRETVLRRARGFAPLPVLVPKPLRKVLAVGAHLKNTVAIAIGRQVHLSQHIGDLETAEAMEHFRRTMADLCRLYEFEPDVVACDLHPGYLSTQHAEEMGLPLVKVQHHMAHVAACAAENAIDEDNEPYLGVAWDGTGLGTDGVIWGSEFFVVDAAAGYHRVAHLLPFRLPGGEQAVRDCRRTALSLLVESGVAPIEKSGIAEPQAGLLATMVRKGLHSPWTTSAGRLFDAVAALSGVAAQNAFEGQAPMHLEACAERASGVAAYPHELLQEQGKWLLDWRPLIDALLRDTAASREEKALRFHLATTEWIVAVAQRVGVSRVVLSGGCFQNALLVELVRTRLTAVGMRCYTHQRVPPNDGGIALGQAVLASSSYASKTHQT